MFYPEHCDNICTNCEKNKNGWCIWKDRDINSKSCTITASEDYDILAPTVNTASGALCPRCGEKMIKNTSKVCTSIPPKYEYICPHCGIIDYRTY